ncbi:condensation domain-containing protein, partial [Chitinophaga sp. Hz27]|uniref:condensation domain-containing protein n=1 Tax=Chitinophaga sp. Hz27 TaxID=3347169 RepID=UPI0035DE9B44
MKQQSTLDLSALDINSNIPAKNYWRNRLSDFQFVNYFKRLEIPAMQPSGAWENYAFTADEEVRQAFNELAGSATAKHIVLMAAIGALLGKCTAVTDAMLFTPVYKDSDHKNASADIIPFRLHVAATATFAELITAVKDNIIKDLAYSNYPLERIFGKEKKALPLSAAISVLLDEIQDSTAFDQLSTGLLFSFNTLEGKLYLDIKYNNSLYLQTFIQTIGHQFFNLLGKLLANRKIPLNDIALLTPSEKVSQVNEVVSFHQQGQLLASYHQERMWFIDYFEAGDLYEGGPVYHNIPLILNLNGRLDIPRLEESVRTLLGRYEILRTVILNVDDHIIQQIVTDPVFQFRLISADSEEELVSATSTEINIPFKLDQLLLRGVLIDQGTHAHRMVLVFHHAIADRYTVKQLTQELLAIYAGADTAPAKTIVPYQQFSGWQRERFGILGFHLYPFWERTLSGGKLKALELPTDRPRAKIHIYKAAVANISFPAAITAKLLNYQATTGMHIRLLLLTAFKVLLHRYAGHEEIVIGTSSDNRTAALAGMIGPVANLIVIRSFVPENSSFKDYLQRISVIYEDAMAHAEMPFDKLVADLAPEKDMARTALFDVLFQYEELNSDLPSIDALTVTTAETNLGYGKYDLNLMLQLNENELQGQLVYNEAYLDSETITALLRNFYELTNNLITSSEERLSSIRMLAASEEATLLQSLDNSKVGYPTAATVHQLFEHQALLHPEKIALVFNDQRMSYGELHTASNNVAAYLRQQGVKPGVIVGLMMDRGMEVVIGMLGILKAGGAYLPIDVEYPASRKSYMISDSGTPFLLSTKVVADAREYEVPVHFIEDGIAFKGEWLPEISATPADLCYIIYTSGTTGNPKGVMVGHSQVVRLFFNDSFQFDFNEHDVWTMFHSHCFDFSVWEMYGALLYGGRLVIIPRMIARDTSAYVSVLEKEGVTVLNQTPGSFYQVSAIALATRSRLALRYVIFGGEALVPSMLRSFHKTYPQVKLINMFGITETTVHVTYKELLSADLEQEVSNIGKPIPTLSVYILDEQLR